MYAEDRALTLRREGWGLALTLIGTLALYGAYVWIVLAAINLEITLGEMTMYLLLFRQTRTVATCRLQRPGGRQSAR